MGIHLKIGKARRLRFRFRLIITVFLIMSIFISKIFILLLIIFLILDYLLYRIDKNLIYQAQKELLRKIKDRNISGMYIDRGEHICKEIITKEDLKNKRTSPFISNRMRIPVTYNFIKKYKLFQKKVIDIGCSSGAMTKLYLGNGNTVFGMDMNLSSLRKAKENKIKIFQGDALFIPLKSNSFDVVNFCEVIEHISNPLQSLKEINKISRNNGLLLLTTNNRNAISVLDIINPVIMAEKLLGIYVNGILPPPNLFWEDDYYHTEFSNKDIHSLLMEGGFEIVYQKSTGLFYGIELVFDILPFFISPIKIAIFFYRLEKMLMLFPFLSKLGEHWEIVGKKIK